MNQLDLFTETSTLDKPTLAQAYADAKKNVEFFRKKQTEAVMKGDPKANMYRVILGGCCRDLATIRRALHGDQPETWHA